MLVFIHNFLMLLMCACVRHVNSVVCMCVCVCGGGGCVCHMPYIVWFMLWYKKDMFAFLFSPPPHAKGPDGLCRPVIKLLSFQFLLILSPYLWLIYNFLTIFARNFPSSLAVFPIFSS